MEAVKPAVVNVRVERAADGDAARGPMGPNMDPEMRRFFERFFGEPGGPGGPNGPMPGPQQGPQRQRGEGSGFVISPTASSSPTPTWPGCRQDHRAARRRHRARGHGEGVDEKTDLALVKVDAGKPLPYVTFGDSSKVRVGDTVIAVGNPFGLGGTVTAGIVSATGREIGSGPYDDFLQVDAPINRGNWAARPST